MHSCTPHWISGTSESPHSWLKNNTTDRLNTPPKDNSTKADTTTHYRCLPEEGTKMIGDKQDGSISETPKYPAT